MSGNVAMIDATWALMDSQVSGVKTDAEWGRTFPFFFDLSFVCSRVSQPLTSEDPNMDSSGENASAPDGVPNSFKQIMVT